MSIRGLRTVLNPGTADPDDDSIELGLAQLAAELTQYSPAWFGSDFFKKTITFRLPLDFAVLERVEQARLGRDFTLRVIPRGEYRKSALGRLRSIG